MRALIVSRKRFDPEFGGETQDRPLGGPDELAADFDDLARRDIGVERPAADAVPGLENADGQAPLGEPPRGYQAREARADHRDVHGAGISVLVSRLHGTSPTPGQLL